MSGIESWFCRSAPWRGFAGRAVLPWVLDETPIGPDALEIGAGSGAMAYELLRRRTDLHLTVTDIDPKMVAAATERLAPFGTRATTVVSDATALDVTDGSFDTVCTWLMLHHTITWRDVIADTRRVLRPGGSVVGYDLTDSSIARLIHRLDRSPHHLIAADDLRYELEHHGFEDIHVQRSFAGTVMRFRATVAVA